MARSNFEPARIYPQKRYSAPAPRGARFFARIMLVALGVILIAGAVFIVKAALDDPMKWSDEKALAQIQAYRQQDMVNLNQYLLDQKYQPTGDTEAYIYTKGSHAIVISPYKYDVTVGDGKGNSRQYGAGAGDIFLCRVSWTHELAEAREIITLGEPELRDVSIPSEALAEIIRLANR